MRNIAGYWIAGVLVALASQAQAQQATPRVVDIPTRTGVTQRMLVLSPLAATTAATASTPPPAAAKAAVILLAGGHGGLQIYPNGSFKWGAGNFLVRARQLFADQGLMVAVVDAPSDRQNPPYLSGFRQKPEHAADMKAAIAWMREQSKAPVWLVGTSRGTQSAAYVATELSGPEGPDGIVLTSTILTDTGGRPVPAMPLEKIRVPVLVVHHEQDGCALCSFANVPALMAKLDNSPKKELLSFKGGENKGDACEAMAYHGFNGLDREVVQQISDWILAK